MPKCWQIDLNFKKPYRMHQNSPFRDPQSKNFLGRGQCPLLRGQCPPLETPGEGETPSHTTHPSAPTAPRFSCIRRSTSTPSAPRSMVPPMLNRNWRPWPGTLVSDTLSMPQPLPTADPLSCNIQQINLLFSLGNFSPISCSGYSPWLHLCN